MRSFERRSLLRLGGLLMGGGVAGCASRFRESTPTEWPNRSVPEEGPVEWRLSEDGALEFPPAILDDAVYVPWRVESSAGALTSVDADDGSVRWHERLERAPHDAPMMADDALFVVTGTGGRQGVDQRLHRFTPDGGRIWSTEPRQAFIELHAVDERRAYLGTRDDEVSCGNEPLFAVDRDAGEGAWSKEFGDSLSGWRHAGGLVVECGTTAVVGLAPGDGTERWRLPGRTLTDGRGRLAQAGDLAFIADGDSVSAVDGRTGATAWTADGGAFSGVPLDGTVVDSVLTVGDASGRVTAVDASDGTRRWQWEGAAEKRLSLAAGDGTLFVSDGAGTLAALAPGTGDERWTATTGDVLDLRPSDGKLVVRSRHGSDRQAIGVYDVASGQRRYRYETSEQVTGLVAGGQLVLVAEGSGGLVALGS